VRSRTPKPGARRAGEGAGWVLVEVEEVVGARGDALEFGEGRGGFEGGRKCGAGASLEGPFAAIAEDWVGMEAAAMLSGAFAVTPALVVVDAGFGCASTKVVRRNWPKEEVVEETMPLGWGPDIVVAISKLWAWARESEAPCHVAVWRRWV
jgi:hypothetical protein